jgi:DNA-binding transcriptional MerR regulator
MLRRWVAHLLKPYIEEMVDQRFKEKMYERYYESKQNDLQERIQRLRNTYFPPSTQRVQTEAKREEEPSGVLEVPGPEEPRVRKKNVKRKVDNSNWYEDTMAEVEKARKKREEMDALKKKLTAKNNWKK